MLLSIADRFLTIPCIPCSVLNVLIAHACSFCCSSGSNSSAIDFGDMVTRISLSPDSWEDNENEESTSGSYSYYTAYSMDSEEGAKPAKTMDKPPSNEAVAKEGIILVPAEPKEKEKEKEKEREKPRRNKDAHEKDRGCRCNICGQYVKVKENLERHQEESTRCRKYQGQEAYRQCKYCGKWVSGQEGAMYQHINSEACLSVFESKRRRKDGAGDGDNGASAKVILREPLPRRRPDAQPRHDPEPEPNPMRDTQPQPSPLAPASASASSSSSSRQMTFMNCTVHIA